ncbi:MAG: transglutaminaseTgpA domain-containing protein [Giesbergeria sp.]
MNLRATLTHLPREARDTLFLLGVIGCVLLPLFPYLPVWTAAFSTLLLLWRAGLALGSRSLPPRWLLVALLALAVAATLGSFRTIVGREAGVVLVAMLLALKTLEARARRDAMVIFFLGFFTMLSNFFFSQSLITAVAMLVALVGLLTALVNAHMPVGRPPLTLALRSAARMALFGTPVMVALFMFFPRMAPLWGLPGDNLSGRSGLSGSMKVGSLAEMALDDAVALRVRFDGPDSALPPQSAMYFRGPVLSDFDGREWQVEPIRDTQHTPALLQVQGPGIGYEMTLEPNQKPWLLLLDASPEGPKAIGLQAFMSRDLQWLSARPVSDVLRYRATSYPQFRHGPLTETRSLRFLTALPGNSDPRTRELAAQMLADPALAAGGTQALVDAALTRLRTGGYAYTLAPGVYGEDTADEFWFNQKAGFCEHIASAFVVLMRAAHVPARIVTGYQGGERNSVDGYWTVRQSDAHAWAEVWIDKRGWVRVDPTGAISPERIGAFTRLRAPRGALGNAMDNVISPGMAQQLRAVWEAANNRWNQWVLNYTQTRQLDMLKAIGFDAPEWQDLIRLLAGLIATIALGGGAWSAWERLQHDPWLRLLARARQRLAGAGLPLPAHLPPRGMAEAVRAHFGVAGEPVAAWLLTLEALRYAPAGAANAPHIAALRRSLAQLAWPTAPPPSP